MANLELEKINKIYPNGVQAVYDFNLNINDREFIVLVGPSGCGKSTTLRMIAGLEDITSGTLTIDSEYMNDKAPKDRNIAMVFQSYALYPHMTVYENMAFGLKLKKFKKVDIQKKVNEAAEILGLRPYLKRKPKALSGGQRQRVALGRAIVRDAKVFLMDEPLSNLDAKLRVQMRGELIKLHKKIETTTVYVTHDQIEAMTMADRIVVMKDGFVQQIDTPKNVYDYPVNMFVAGFIGTPPMNFVDIIVNDKGEFMVNTDKMVLPPERINELKDFDFLNKKIIMGIRPEDIYAEEEYKSGKLKFSAKIEVAELLGAGTNIYMQLNEYNVCASIKARSGVKMHDDIKLVMDAEKLYFFDPETQIRLRYENGKPINLLEQPDGLKKNRKELMKVHE